MLIDSHAHLADSKFDIDRELVISRARASGVEKIIEVSCEPYTWKKSFHIAELNKDVFCSFGIHPHEAKLANSTIIADLEQVLSFEKTVAIGEIGLDYYYNHSPKEVQLRVFRLHLDLATKLSKPVIIHCRDAYGELIDILKGFSGLKGVIHCFSGTLEEANALVTLGFYLGIDGPVTYPKAKTLHQVVKEISLEKILLETDSPYLAPQQHRGKRNEPSYLLSVAQEIAALKDIDADIVINTTTANTKSLFNFTI